MAKGLGGLDDKRKLFVVLGGRSKSNESVEIVGGSG